MTAAVAFKANARGFGGYNYSRFIKDNAVDHLKQYFGKALKSKLEASVETAMQTVGSKYARAEVIATFAAANFLLERLSQSKSKYDLVEDMYMKVRKYADEDMHMHKVVRDTARKLRDDKEELEKMELMDIALTISAAALGTEGFMGGYRKLLKDEGKIDKKAVKDEEKAFRDRLKNGDGIGKDMTQRVYTILKEEMNITESLREIVEEICLDEEVYSTEDKDGTETEIQVKENRRLGKKVLLIQAYKKDGARVKLVFPIFDKKEFQKAFTSEAEMADHFDKL